MDYEKQDKQRTRYIKGESRLDFLIKNRLHSPSTRDGIEYENKISKELQYLSI